MRIRNRVAVVVSGAVLVGTASLLASLPTGLPAGAVKALSAPVFVGNATIKAKVGKPLAHTLKAKANPVASISVVGALPPGVTFVPDDTTGTGLLADPTPLGGSYPITFQATNSQGTTTLNATLVVKSKLPPLRHVFVIMLENEGYNATFGGPNNYLNTTLPAQGALLTNYYGVGHFSNDNYTGFISGQPPTADNQIDCLGTNGFTDFPAGSGLDANGIQQGNGCVYPAGVPTLADQLTGDGLTWKGYQEDMGNVPTRESATCGHPTVGGTDGTAGAVPGDGYASRHDPFVYFHSIIDNTTECNQDVVPLGDTSGNLPAERPGRHHRPGHRPPVGGHHAQLQLHHPQPVQRRPRLPVPQRHQPRHLGRQRHQRLAADLDPHHRGLARLPAGRPDRGHLRRVRRGRGRRHRLLR